MILIIIGLLFFINTASGSCSVVFVFLMVYLLMNNYVLIFFSSDDMHINSCTTTADNHWTDTEGGVIRSDLLKVKWKSNESIFKILLCVLCIFFFIIMLLTLHNRVVKTEEPVVAAVHLSDSRCRPDVSSTHQRASNGNKRVSVCVCLSPCPVLFVHFKKDDCRSSTGNRALKPCNDFIQKNDTCNILQTSRWM